MTKSRDFRLLTVGDFIVKPVQRLPKYVLLLKDLLKNTDFEHPDFLEIQQAYELYSKVNDDNNANMFRAS